MFIIFANIPTRILLMLVAKLLLFFIITLIYQKSNQIIFSDEVRKYAKKVDKKEYVSIYESLYVLCGLFGMIGSIIFGIMLILNIILTLVSIAF